MHIGITYDLRSDYLALGYGEEETAEFDQVGTIDAIDGALCELGHTTDRIGHARNLIERLAAGDRWDLVFNICEGLHGLARKAQVPAILDVYDIPYTFADPAALCVCLDKALTKTVLRAAGVPTPDWHVVRELSDIERCQLPFPLIAKPLAEGTGKGINAASKITDRTALRRVCERIASSSMSSRCSSSSFCPAASSRWDSWVRAQTPKSSARLEILLRDAAEPDVYSYVNKEQSEDLCDIVLVRASEDAAVAEAERIALAAWRAVAGRDAGRIDLRCDATGKPQLMEINPLAGLHPTHSDLPAVWTEMGVDVCRTD